MTQHFGHEKLIVYQKAMGFVVLRSGLLDRLRRRVAACDHLERAAESILVNIAHASSAWTADERIVCLGHANGSALECAACLDVLVAKTLPAAEDVFPGKWKQAVCCSAALR
ncbi:MAG: four helix bundle protein [Kiritimatiellae bacterium]|nr:four helix bundle protein [Kiritimatiellia bacterium]